MRIESTNEVFQLGTSGLSAPIQPGSSAPLMVEFRPVADGEVSGEIRVFLQGGGAQPLVLAVEGLGEMIQEEGNGCSAAGSGDQVLLALWALGTVWLLRRAQRKTAQA
ncbi:hypothetical protein POL68_17980 [Stigmatella sp. ncwal1]|uniref:Uncharacterized protein n=1 Tax=Stigmatella ashevillensis TaxID=2995309 RepID=A0ABT5DDF2_9BACT|nr:hypothetical protein [Stigmatella ashevillena]MDC0710371.1 hypothetical protein [Stigmatella ashevillena]